MPELPEITLRASEMKRRLVGKTITGIKVSQPKSLNVPKKNFIKDLNGAKLLDVVRRGEEKWLEEIKNGDIFYLKLNSIFCSY